VRRREAVLLAAFLTALAAGRPGASQPPAPGDLPLYHRHLRVLEIPVDVTRIEQLQPRPSELQLFWRVPTGRWQTGSRTALAALPAISDGKRGFRFTAPDDGEYQFRVQFVYPDGSVSPREVDMTPDIRVQIDTAPPQVQVRVTGKAVEWVASDINLAPTVSLQCKWAKDAKGKEWGLDEGEWFPIEPKSRGAFRPRDGFDWTGVLPQGQELWVRVAAKDQAGNEGFSPPVRVPGTGTFGTAFPKTNPDWPPTGGNPNPNPGLPKAPQPRIEYVASTDVTIEYALRKIPRSGIQAFHLFVQTEKDPTGWQFVEKFPQRAQAGDRDQSVQLKYRAEREGLYGFYVVAESGAAIKDDLPTKADPPMMFVVVDHTAPYAKITGVQARKGGPRGPIVDLTWQVADPNLMPKSISLEYSVDRNAKVWNKIEYGLDNEPGKDTGRCSWEVPDENLWKFYVRIRAVDKAANTGEHVWEQEVIVDLEKPSGVITGVRGGNSPVPSPIPKPNPGPPAGTQPQPKPMGSIDPMGPIGPTSPMMPMMPERVGPPLPNLPDKN
jgi:hypothetical protein